ncbi:unnamed protein product [Dovyalis caffra]|uniref:Uncharacterized protein n=1 Tax=Dovyalis caffra TaxID=77055 RepID=A0AAV1QMN4_9ROSI|nr:unnamed protein product [Dovyalis caffra]
MKIVAGVDLAIAVTKMLLLAIVCIRWQKKPQDWEKRSCFSLWLLPLCTNQSSFLTSKSSSRRSSVFGFGKSKSGYSSYFSNQGLGRYFNFSELQNATQNFDEKVLWARLVINLALPREQVNLVEWAMRCHRK